MIKNRVNNKILDIEYEIKEVIDSELTTVEKREEINILNNEISEIQYHYDKYKYYRNNYYGRLVLSIVLYILVFILSTFLLNEHGIILYTLNVSLFCVNAVYVLLVFNQYGDECSKSLNDLNVLLSDKK